MSRTIEQRWPIRFACGKSSARIRHVEPVFNHQLYSEILQAVETAAELAILYFVIKEGGKVVDKVTDIYDSTATVVGLTDELPIGSRVHVLTPVPGKPRSEWSYSTEVWVIREVDKEKKRATATPVFPPPGQIPIVSGPMSGPLSPFNKLNSPG